MISTGSVGRIIGSCLLAGVLTACSGNLTDRTASLEGYTPEHIFERGEYELADGRSEDAATFSSKTPAFGGQT